MPDTTQAFCGWLFTAFTAVYVTPRDLKAYTLGSALSSPPVDVAIKESAAAGSPIAALFAA